MKKLLLVLFCQFALFALLPMANAQTTKEESKEKSKDKNVEKEVENALNEAVNQLEGLFNNKPKKRDKKEQEPVGETKDKSQDNNEDEQDAAEEEAAQEIMNSIFGSEEDQQPYVPKANEFTGSFTMVYEAFKNGKPDKNNPSIIKFTFDKWQTGLEMSSKENEKARVIMDLKDNTMTTITTDNGKTNGFKMRRPNVKKYTDEVMDHMEVTRTGEFRTIDGYRCEKVIYKNIKDETVTTAWITNDLGLQWKQITESMTMGRMPGNYDKQKMMEGFAIESETVERGGKETYTMKTKDIRVGSFDKAVFDTSGVEVVTMPGFGG